MHRLLIFLCAAALLRAASSPPPISSAPVDSSEDAIVTVMKVFEAADQGAACRSYLVKWKGQEVVIVDNLLQTAAKVGDTLPVRVLRYAVPGAKDGRRVLTFAIVKPQGPAAPARVAPGLPAPRSEATPADDEVRKKAVAAEVERRRLLREGVGQGQPPPK